MFRFQFKKQDFQEKAIQSIIDVFEGLPKQENINQWDLKVASYISVKPNQILNNEFLPKEKILEKINQIQERNGILKSEKLYSDLGAVQLDIEMETGTGKTYVYLKTIFELNKKYGFTKFIIVVPRIAIREGVKKTLEVARRHFAEIYNEEFNYFVFDSSDINQIRHFVERESIDIMIINSQAFASSANNKIIQQTNEKFNDKSALDLISKTRPILILDEPQKLSGKATKEGLQSFNPLFSLYFSATHEEKHNKIYSLDPIDAYNQKIVKQISVKAVSQNINNGIDGYMYLEEIKTTSSQSAPTAKIEIDVRSKSGTIKKKVKKFQVGDSIYEESGKIESYKNYEINDINSSKSKIIFTNGQELKIGEIQANEKGLESAVKRVQIRETIKSHLLKEKENFEKGIKTLSLFFIDRVIYYKNNNKNIEDKSLIEIYKNIFEREYENEVEKYISKNDEYAKYLKKFSVSEIHNGYFSIDKTTGEQIEKEKSTNKEEMERVFNLIMKDKERLLSLNEPTRFIFSHSALSEGWDNPNIFQICFLKKINEDKKETSTRQEIGRGLRLAVDQNGIRQDKENLGEYGVHNINKLMVIVNGKAEHFIQEIQKEIKEKYKDRINRLKEVFLLGENIKNRNNKILKIDEFANREIKALLSRYQIFDDEGNIDPLFHEKKKNGDYNDAFLNTDFQEFEEEIFDKILEKISLQQNFEKMISNENTAKKKITRRDQSAHFKDFRELWDSISQKYYYKVNFSSQELILKSIKSINEKMKIQKNKINVESAEQVKSIVNSYSDSFGKVNVKGEENTLLDMENYILKFDIVSKIQEYVFLTRKTIINILKGIHKNKFILIKESPEEFTSNISKLILEVCSEIIIDNIEYFPIEDKRFDFDKTFLKELEGEVQQNFVSDKFLWDEIGKENKLDSKIEEKFFKDLSSREDVKLFAKLLRNYNENEEDKFYIPTPIGRYVPDWAIVSKNSDGITDVKFIVETKGSNSDSQLRTVEKNKIKCAEKLFKLISERNENKIIYTVETDANRVLDSKY